MSVSYKPILWNRFKIQYDTVLWASTALYLAGFAAANLWLFPDLNPNTVIIRALGTWAILLLHVILAIGPLARLSSAFLPLLYNRRHLGVSMFFIAAGHGLYSLFWFHGNGNVNPLLSLFLSNTHYTSLAYFPFQPLGFVALLILGAMAFTSHDFWLNYLSPTAWKRLHMLVYVAYGLILLHVALGIIQFERSPVLVAFLFMGLATLATLHLLTGFKEASKDASTAKSLELMDDGWFFAGMYADIPEARAKVVFLGGERIAIFKDKGKLSAVHNVCKHQLGPLGEGKVIDGCITCPWHGYQYRPEDGCSPPPFTEKVHTYALRLVGERVYVNPAPMPEGTFIAPVGPSDAEQIVPQNPFFIGWSSANAKSLFVIPRFVAFFLVGGGCLAGLLFVAAQQRISSRNIDYNQSQTLEGWLSIEPVPHLLIVDGKNDVGGPSYKSVLLVDGFKHGAQAVLANYIKGPESPFVKVTGYVSRDLKVCGPGATQPPCLAPSWPNLASTNALPLMEIENGQLSIQPSETSLIKPVIDVVVPRDTVLEGEIVDTKCYMGAMNPGQGKPHLSCAVRCISGGIMPALKVKLPKTLPILLVGPDGQALGKDLLDRVGLPQRVKGKLGRFYTWEILYVEGFLPQ